MHYLDEGSGPPVVMVHGNPSWSFYYRNLVLALRDTHRCLVPDHIGMGLSDKPVDYPYTLAQRVADFTAWLEQLAVKEPVTLVVHDWGGMIAMTWAAKHPERVARLVILNTAAFPLPASKPFPWPLALTRTPIGTVLVRGFNAFAWTAIRVGCTRRSVPAAVRAAYTAPYDSWRDRVATLRFVQDIPLRPGDPGYELIDATAKSLDLFGATPTFIGWGLRDFVFDRHFLDEWRRRLPQAVVHALADAGHYVLEDADEELIPLIASFVRGAG